MVDKSGFSLRLSSFHGEFMLANSFDSNFGCCIASHVILDFGSSPRWHPQRSGKLCSRPSCLKCSSSMFIGQRSRTTHELFNFSEFCFGFGLWYLISMNRLFGAAESYTTDGQLTIKDLPCHPLALSFDRRLEQPDVQMAEAHAHAPCTFLPSVTKLQP